MAVAITQTASVAGGASSGGLITFSGVAIGTAAANRIVVVNCTTDDNADYPASATCDHGGGAETMQQTPRGSFGSMSSVTFWIDAPTGTTADIVVNIGGSIAANASAITVYSVTGARIQIIGAGAGSTDMDASAPLTTGALTTPTNGGIILSACGASNTSTFAWSANVTESVAEVHTGTYTYGAAHTTTAITATAVTCTGSVNAQDGALSWLAFGPGANAGAAFVGAGNSAFSNSRLAMASNAAFAGIGNLVVDSTVGQSATQWSGEAAFVGTGAFFADLIKQPLYGQVAFVGAGSLVANALHFSAGIYDETGAATLSVSGSALTELEFGLKLDYDNLVTGDVLSFRIYLDGSPLTTYNLSPSITVAAHAISATAAFAGVGTLTVDSTVSRGALTASAALIGAGNLVATPTLQMLAQIAALTATGTQIATPTLLMRAQETLTGAGSFSASLTALRLVSNTTFAGAGNLSAAASKITLSALASFAGAGSLAASNTVLLMRDSTESLSGTGNMAASAIMRLSPTATFAGVGSMVADLVKSSQALQGQAAYIGAGSLAATVKLNMVASAAMSAAGSFAASSTNLILRDTGEALSATGNMAATGKLLAQAQANFAGVGVMIVTPQEWMAARASFAGAGALVADLVKLANYWSGEAAFIGAGNMAITPKLLAMAQANFTATGAATTTPQLRMVASAIFSASGSLVADLTRPIQGWAGSAAFIGSGSLAATSVLALAANTAFAGVGSFLANSSRTINVTAETFSGVGAATFSAIERMAAAANFAGAGSLVVDAIQAGKLFGSVAFLGASNMLINTSQRMAATAAYLGDSNISITPRLLMRIAKTTYRGESWFDAEPGLAMKAGARATFSGVGNQSVLANLLYNLSARYAGIGNMATTPRLNMDSGEVDFTGVGSMAAVTRQRMAVTGTFGGESDFDITPRLRMRAFANYSGEGSMFVDLTPPIMAWTGQAAFTGEGALSAVGTFDLTAAASMEAAGNLSVDTIRFINLSEQFFAGTGSFIVGDVQQILAGFVNYGGTGYFSIHTTISSARLEWLVCASIGFKPELDVALTISPELPASLAVNAAIEGKPEMKVC